MARLDIDRECNYRSKNRFRRNFAIRQRLKKPSELNNEKESILD